MPDRDSGFEDRPPGVERGVWTTRPVTTIHQPTQATPPVAPVAAVAPLPAARQSLVQADWRRGLRSLVRVAFWLVIVAASIIGVLIVAYRWVAPPTTTLILAQKLTGTDIQRAWRPLDQISPHLARAVIMSEDAGFCGHRGVDFAELERVYERGIEGGSRGGGSTIAMQVTKNLFLWPSKSYIRKAIEIPMTLVADRWWGKRRTLEIYLNIAEWGSGIFGAEAAARSYFGKPASQLSEFEAALLAVALPNPLARNAAEPSAQQKRMASVVQARMRSGARNVRCLSSAPR